MIIYSDHRMSYSMPDHWVLYVLVNLTHGRSIQEFPASLTRALHRLVALRTEQCTVLWCLQLPQQRRCSAWSEDEHELPSHMKPRIVMSFLLSNVDLLCPRLPPWVDEMDPHFRFRLLGTSKKATPSSRIIHKIIILRAPTTFNQRKFASDNEQTK